MSVSLNGLDADEIVVECVLGHETELGEFVPSNTFTLKLTGEIAEGAAVFHGDLWADEKEVTLEGLEDYKIRVFPRHRLLCHQFEPGCMLWL